MTTNDVSDTRISAELLPCPFCGGAASEMMGLVGCEPCSYARRDAASWNRRASRHAQPVNEPGEWPDVDEIAQIIRTVDGGHMQGAGQLAERIVAHLNLRAASIPKVEPRASTVFQAIRGYLDAAVAHADVMAAIESALEPSPSTSEGEAVCPDCKRHVMSVPEPATGWIAKCGRRLTRLSECGSGIECDDYAAPQPTSVSPLPVGVTPDAWRQVTESLLKEAERMCGPGPMLDALTAALSPKPGEEG